MGGQMARKTQPTKRPPNAEGTPDDGGTSAVGVRRNDDEDDPLSALAGIRSNDVLHIQRMWPPSSAGWLGDVELPPGGIDDLYQLIRDQYGGGRYSLRVKRKKPGNNGLPFTNITAKVTIAGAPKSGLDEPGHHAMQHAPAPVVIQGGGGNEQLQTQMLGMLSRALQSGGGNGVNLAELAKVIFQATTVSQQRSDSIGDLERTLGLLAKMRNAFAPKTEPVAESNASPLAGLLGGGGGGLENMLIAKILGGLGGGQPAPQQPPPTIPPAPSPQHVFHPAHGWFVPPNLAPKSEPVTQHAAPRPASEPPSVAGPRLVELDDDAPLTADEIEADIDQLDEAERERLLTRLMQAQLGKIDPAEMQRLMGGASPSIADAYPVTATENG